MPACVKYLPGATEVRRGHPMDLELGMDVSCLVCARSPPWFFHSALSAESSLQPPQAQDYLNARKHRSERTRGTH